MYFLRKVTLVRGFWGFDEDLLSRHSDSLRKVIFYVKEILSLVVSTNTFSERVGTATAGGVMLRARQPERFIDLMGY